ncbi:MAG: VWA domain-containing protein [Negativicutes bacterium]|nr:VWA domain-containing protein [Negativicutes bacterium]
MQKLEQIFAQNRGARIGESTVVSRNIHTYDPARPEEIIILQDADAGRVFYHRQTVGEVYHLDIFHEKGIVDHRLVAMAVKEAVTRYNTAHTIENCLSFRYNTEEVKADYIDIQTGSGGGRITGSLNFGQKLSLRRAHENHVHVAASLPAEHLACLFPIVMAVEKVILSAGLEIRRNERILHQKGGERDNCDMSAYSDYSDSFLRNKGALANLSPTAKKYQHTQDAVDLLNDFDSIRDFVDTVSNTGQATDKQALLRQLEQTANGEQTLHRLSAMGIIEYEKNKVKITEYGKEFLDYVKLNTTEIEAHFRRQLRLLKPGAQSPGRQRVFARDYHSASLRGFSSSELSTHWRGEIDTASTVIAAAQRTIREAAGKFCIIPDDVRQKCKRRRKKVGICLVLDVSASMSGLRLKAAKFLAKHLLLSIPDRISVVTFQGQSAQVEVPLTRDYRQIEESLRKLRAFGSTPLAQGIRVSLAHLKTSCVKNPLIVLITDGVATYSDDRSDPLAEALAAACEIKAAGYDFTCIGLKPHQNYLTKLSEAAGGSVCIVSEFNRQELVKAVWNKYAERR